MKTCLYCRRPLGPGAHVNRKTHAGLCARELARKRAAAYAQAHPHRTLGYYAERRSKPATVMSSVPLGEYRVHLPHGTSYGDMWTL